MAICSLLKPCFTLAVYRLFYFICSLRVSWFFQLQINLASACPGFAQSHTKRSFAAADHCSAVVPFDSLEVQTMSTVSDPFVP